MRLSRKNKWLLACSAALLIIAEIIRRLPMSSGMTLAVGVVELLLAIAIGIAFGVVASRKTE